MIKHYVHNFDIPIFYDVYLSPSDARLGGGGGFWPECPREQWSEYDNCNLIEILNDPAGIYYIREDDLKRMIAPREILELRSAIIAHRGR